MVVLIVGGAGSGKSEFAENLAVKLHENKLYIATMIPFGDEAQMRIEKHRRMRKDKGFDSIDISHRLHEYNCGDSYNLILLECMSNLVANEMYCENGNVDHIIDGITHLSAQVEDIIIVSNDVFGDGKEYSQETLDYIENIGKINVKIGGIADVVVEIVASIPIYHRGGKLN